MKYNPQIHHRRSIRLKGYDYAQAGLYFVTLCVKNRFCLFGDVVNGTMQTNPAGQMVQKWFYELENKFPDIKCHEMMVMPNHFHCIIENVGADLRVCPNDNDTPDLRVCPNDNDEKTGKSHGDTGKLFDYTGQSHRIAPTEEHIDIQGEHIGSPQQIGSPLRIGSPLHRVVQWFKTMTTNEYIRGVKNDHWQPFDGKLWQRNYWEHIIRNEKSYHNISAYIVNNPLKWDTDTLNPNYNHP